jgi:hypothetical protein
MRRLTAGRLLVVLPVAACLAMLPAGAAAATHGAHAAKLSGIARTYTASAGAVAATLSATEYGAGTPTPTFARLTLTITRSGSAAYSAPVRSRYCEPCALRTLAGASAPLLVSDLEGDGDADVIVELNSGGAHCCTIVQVLSYDPATMTYRSAERSFGDPGALLTDVAGNGSAEFESADDRFAYAFAPYAYSGLPLQILAFRAGSFTDVTRSYPVALAKDAARWLKAFRAQQRHGLGNGLIAAWAADEELLGHRALVRATLAREARHGRLRDREHYGPSGRAFVTHLLRFLVRTGYR